MTTGRCPGAAGAPSDTQGHSPGRSESRRLDTRGRDGAAAGGEPEDAWDRGASATQRIAALEIRERLGEEPLEGKHAAEGPLRPRHRAPPQRAGHASAARRVALEPIDSQPDPSE